MNLTILQTGLLIMWCCDRHWKALDHCCRNLWKCYCSHMWISFFQVNISSRFGTMSLSTTLTPISNIIFSCLGMLALTDFYFLGNLNTDSEIQIKIGRKKRSNFTCEQSMWAKDLDMLSISKRSELIIFMSSKDNVNMVFIVYDHEDMFLAHRNILATYCFLYQALIQFK
jgi:hypothetical protein